MSQDSSAQPSRSKPVVLNNSIRVRGVIEPWHHSNEVPVPLKAGLKGKQLPNGNCCFSCADGKHTVSTAELPPAVLSFL